MSTLYRWSTSGTRGVVLETLQIAGSRCTSVAALQRFFDQLTARSDSEYGRVHSVDESARLKMADDEINRRWKKSRTSTDK